MVAESQFLLDLWANLRVLYIVSRLIIIRACASAHGMCMVVSSSRGQLLFKLRFTVGSIGGLVLFTEFGIYTI